jgi:thiol-disulfide isomerase/thioredoxin
MLIRSLTACVAFVCLAVASQQARASDSLDLSAYRGKVVLLDFWASWCEPCRRSFPWLNEMRAKYGDRGLVVIGINVDRTQTDAARFLRDVPASFPIVYDPSGKLATQYDVPGMPSSFVVGPDGAIAARHIGFRDSARAEREAELQRLLSGPGVVPIR